MNKNYDYKRLTPFKWFVLQNFPFIDEDFDAITNYQLFCKLGEEINKIIDSQNIVGEQAETLTNAFNNLKNYVDNYFENLDVQDEINNKLNEMVEDGTFQSILLNYTSIQKIYNTFNDMINDNSLVANQKVKTLGYYKIGDGGGADYVITDSEPDSYFNRTSNNLYAKLLIYKDFINVLKIGCKNDNDFDNSSIINNALNYFTTLYFPSGKYKVLSPINLKNKKSYKIMGSQSTTYSLSDLGNGSIIVGNTGSNPIINAIGALNITLKDLLLFSDDNSLSSPSVLGILQGCTTERPFSQFINLDNIYINLISSPNSNKQLGSIGVYNWQSELNSYINCFFTADIPVVLTREDETELAKNFGCIRPIHDSLTGNVYTNLETQSKLEYTMLLGGDSATFSGFYGQGTVKFLDNYGGDHQTNNIFLNGVIEKNNENTNSSVFEMADNCRLSHSFIHVTTVHFNKCFNDNSSNNVLTQNYIDIVGNFTDYFSSTNIRFNNNIIMKGNNTLNNLFSQGNILLGGTFDKILKNNNFNFLNDGTFVFDENPIIFSKGQPSRTDLPNQALAFNFNNNNFMAWKYSTSLQSWLPIAPGRPTESDTGSISNVTPQIIGQLLHDVNTNDMYIAYGTEKGNWKKIT